MPNTATLLMAGYLVLLSGLRPHGVHAQSIARGELGGLVTSTDGGPLAGVPVTVTRSGGQSPVFFESDRDGSFQVPLLPAGDYDVLVEARGYTPQLVTDVGIRPGQTVTVDVRLEPTTPPVVSVDTVSARGGAISRYDGLGSRWLSNREIDGFPDARMGLNGLITLNSSRDGGFGAEGLPGSATVILVDGFPFTPARHPLQQAASAAPLFPRTGLASVDVHSRSDVEWSGGAGGIVSAVSGASQARRSYELQASASSDVLWQSESLADVTVPGMSSGWGSGSLLLPVQENRGQFFIAAEGIRLQTPYPSPVSAGTAGRLVASSPSLDALDADRLVAPWLSTLQGATALSRLDWRTEGLAEVMLRAGFSSVSERGTEFFGLPLAYASPMPFEGTDLFIGASTLNRWGDLWLLELRGGFESSQRDSAGTMGPDGTSRIAPTMLLEDGVVLGPDPGLAASVTRTSFQGSATAHVRWEGHWLKFGAATSVPSYDYQYSYASAGTYVLSRPESVFLGEGLFSRATGTIGTASFTVPEFSVFAQYQWEPDPSLRITTGLRFDHESLPSGEAPRNVGWATQTQLINSRFESGLSKFAPQATVSWDVSGTGDTVLEATLGVIHDQLDPSAIGEVFALSGAISDYRQIGGLSRWPELPGELGGNEDSGVALALFGPDMTAPRTTRTTLGLSQRLTERTSLHVSGTYRRTEFLLRRDDLNLSIVPSGSLMDGRPVYGRLAKLGTVIAVEPGSNHRFSDFGSVRAFSTDGWSEYTGLTVSVDHAASDILQVFGSYTVSSTEDNLIGGRGAVPDAQLDPRVTVAPEDWSVGTSDFDLPHRVAAGFQATLPLLEGLEASGVYRFRSGWAFTPGYQPGVDVNGDGSAYNDPAFVPSDLSSLSGDVSCLNADVGQLATRNACRGPSSHSLDLHVDIGLARLGSTVASLTFDAFNVVDTEVGLPDAALLLIDADGELTPGPSAGQERIPVLLNPNFGQTPPFFRTGRLLRIGLRLALP